MRVADPVLRLVQRVLLCSGVLALLLGAWSAGRQWREARHAVAAPGVVVQVVEEWSSGSAGRSSTYKPVVRFRGRDGREITFRDRLGTRPPRFRPGDTVRVWYDPAAAETARVDAPFLLTWMLPLIAATIGCAFLLMAGVVIPYADSPYALVGLPRFRGAATVRAAPRRAKRRRR